MSGTFDQRGEIDPNRGVVFCCLGKKRSGKSVMGLLLFSSYPYDRLVIDVNGTDGPFNGVVDVSGTVDTLPDTWGEIDRPDEDQPMTVRYVPDMGSSTFLEDVDHMLGLAHRQGQICILIHEAGQIAPVNRTPANMRRILHGNRHRKLTVILCAPRTMTMDTLAVGQADVLYIFELPNPHDRRRVADIVGLDPADFDDMVHDLPPHGYLRIDTNEDKPAEGQPDLRVIEFPPLPRDVVAGLKRL